MESRSFFFRGSQEVMEFAQRSCMPRQRAEASPKNKSGWCTQFRQFWKPWFISGKQKHISRKGPEVGISRIELIEFFPEFLFKTHIPILVRNGQRSASVAAFKKFYQEIQAKCDSLGFGDMGLQWMMKSFYELTTWTCNHLFLWNQVMRVGGAALQVSREMAMFRGRFHSYGRFWNPVGLGQRNTIWRVIA